MHRRTLAVIAAPAAVAVILASGCSSGKKSAKAGAGSVSVFAASSLTEAFTTLKQQFEAANPGVTIKLNFGASSDLANAIKQGAPADVFASASPKNMQQVSDAGDAATPANFAKNFMEIAVPPDNPADVTRVADLANSRVKVALCAPQVPCGVAAAKVFANSKITVKPVTLEPNVKSAVTKVALGEVDAGMVYVTDVKAAGSKVKGIVIPADINVSTEYPIAALAKAANAAGARAFVAYVLSPAGQSVLAASGFEKP